ncbi:MAG: DNA translocase FtsK 4TM domain-containing protein, partial [Pseudomonadota bacterium]
MAYQTRQRDPFLDRHMQAVLERRGREAVGVLLLAAGVVLALMLVSYAPDDPNWLAATGAAPRNWLGGTGASVAAALMMIVGHAAWV